MKKRLFNIAKVLVGLLLIGWLLSQIDGQALRESMRRGVGSFLWLGFLSVIPGTLLFQVLRLQMLIRFFTPCSFGFSLQITLISLLFNNLLPSSVGGDAVKTIYIREGKQLDWEEIVVIIFVEKGAGILALLSIGLFYFLWFGTSQLGEETAFSLNTGQLKWLTVLAGAAILILGGMFLLFQKRVRNLWQRFRVFFGKTWRTARQLPPWLLIVSYLLSWLIHGTTILGLWWLVQFFGEFITLPQMFFVMFFMSMISFLPISIGALGVRENALLFSFTLFGITETTAIATGLLLRTASIFKAATGGVVYLFFKSKK